MRHLSVIDGGKREFPPGADMRHPVYDKTPLEAHFATDGEPPYMAVWAADVLKLAVGGNPAATKRAPEALEVLSVYFSTPADDCDPHGMERLFPDDGGVA